MSFVEERRILLLLFMLVCAPHALSPVHLVGDSTWTLPTAASLLYQRNADLDEYGPLIAIKDAYTIQQINGHQYNFFPIGTSLVALPFVWAFDTATSLALKIHPPLEDRIRTLVINYIRANPTSTDQALQARKLDFYRQAPINSVYLMQKLEVIIASCIVGLFAIALYLLARQYLGPKAAVGLSLLICYATPVYSTASRGLWQHGPSIVALTLTLYLLVRAKTQAHWAQYAALPLAFAYVIRPTNSIPVLLFTLYVLLYYRRYFIRYVAWSLPVAIPFILYSLLLFGSLLPPYYLPARIGAESHFWEALGGNLFSPNRGLLIFTPFLVFVLVPLFTRSRPNQRDPLVLFVLAAFLLHWLVISSFPHWWGGHCYGPRFFTDMIPFLAWLLLPFIAALPRYEGSLKGRMLIGLFAVLMAFSTVTHVRGAWLKETKQWNTVPQNVDFHPHRLWDWGDMQIFRG